MAQRKLHHLTNLSELVANATNIIVSDIIELLLLVSVERITLAVDQRIGSNNTVLRRISLNDLENKSVSNSLLFRSFVFFLTLNSTALMAPLTRNMSPLRTGRYDSKKYGFKNNSNKLPVKPSTVSAMGST